MSTIDVTVNFKVPDGQHGGSLEFEQGGEKWNPNAVPWSESQTFKLSQGSETTSGWLLWGIIFWGTGYEKPEEGSGKKDGVIQPKEVFMTIVDTKDVQVNSVELYQQILPRKDISHRL